MSVPEEQIYVNKTATIQEDPITVPVTQDIS